MPILGICNGMRLLAVCIGGELVQDIPMEIDAALEHKPEQSATITQHDAEIVSRSRHLDLVSGAVSKRFLQDRKLSSVDHRRCRSAPVRISTLAIHTLLRHK
nr:gamma-glutamyl-gamma-aminobutyrate hydrolase family protein [Rhizobium mesoamericanum]